MLGFKNFDCAATTIAGIERSAVFVKDNSSWGVSVSRTKLPLQSGMRYSPHSLYLSSNLLRPRTYLHQNQIDEGSSAAIPGVP